MSPTRTGPGPFKFNFAQHTGAVACRSVNLGWAGLGWAGLELGTCRGPAFRLDGRRSVAAKAAAAHPAISCCSSCNKPLLILQYEIKLHAASESREACATGRRRARAPGRVRVPRTRAFEFWKRNSRPLQLRQNTAIMSDSRPTPNGGPPNRGCGAAAQLLPKVCPTSGAAPPVVVRGRPTRRGGELNSSVALCRSKCSQTRCAAPLRPVPLHRRAAPACGTTSRGSSPT